MKTKIVLISLMILINWIDLTAKAQSRLFLFTYLDGDTIFIDERTLEENSNSILGKGIILKECPRDLMLFNATIAYQALEYPGTPIYTGKETLSKRFLGIEYFITKDRYLIYHEEKEKEFLYKNEKIDKRDTLYRLGIFIISLIILSRWSWNIGKNKKPWYCTLSSIFVISIIITITLHLIDISILLFFITAIISVIRYKMGKNEEKKP